MDRPPFFGRSMAAFAGDAILKVLLQSVVRARYGMTSEAGRIGFRMGLLDLFKAAVILLNYLRASGQEQAVGAGVFVIGEPGEVLAALASAKAAVAVASGCGTRRDSLPGRGVVGLCLASVGNRGSLRCYQWPGARASQGER